MFTEPERQHLEEMGHVVLRYPEAEGIIDDETFLFCPFLPWVSYIPLLSKRPAVVIGNDAAHMSDLPAILFPCSWY